MSPLRDVSRAQTRGYLRNWRAWLLAVAVTAVLPGTQASAQDDLEVLVTTALDQNPQLTALEAQIAALEHKTTQVGAWQNPKLQLAYQNAPIDSFSMGVEPMTMVMIRLEQTVPFFGKTKDRKGVMRKATEAKRWELAEKKNELRALVETAYYRLALARHLRKLTVDHITLVEQLVDTVRIKYEVGRAPQEHLLRLEVLRDRLGDDLNDFTRQESALTAAINAALHRDPATSIATPDEFSLAEPSMSLKELRELAQRNRPALKQLSATANMHRAAADLAKYEAFPDPTIFASYGIRTELDNGSGGRDLVTFGISISLPVFYNSRNAPQAAEAIELARAADAGHDAVSDSIDGGLGQALATWTRAVGKTKTYREKLVPDARRTLEATLTSYQVDRADFTSLYDAELDLLNFEKTIRIVTVDGLVVETVIEQIIGTRLP